MSSRNWIVVAVIVLTAGVLALAVGGSGGTPADTASPTPSPTSSPTAAATGPASPSTSTPGGFTTLRSEEHRLQIAYPAGWTALESPDPEVLLVATPNGEDSLLLRVVGLDAEVGEEDLPAMQRVTDRIVRSGEGVEVLVGPREISLGGMPGYYYLYHFLDETGGQQGVHAHYFLFDGDRMVVLVFQALPDERFEELAPTFDRIAGSLRLLES